MQQNRLSGLKRAGRLAQRPTDFLILDDGKFQRGKWESNCQQNPSTESNLHPFPRAFAETWK